eukprot:1157478-Pelagomonas_calceolata.AAC.6
MPLEVWGAVCKVLLVFICASKEFGRSCQNHWLPINIMRAWRTSYLPSLSKGTTSEMGDVHFGTQNFGDHQIKTQYHAQAGSAESVQLFIKKELYYILFCKRYGIPTSIGQAFHQGRV